MHHSLIYTHVQTLVHMIMHTRTDSYSHIQNTHSQVDTHKEMQHIFKHTKSVFAHTHTHTAVHCRPWTDQEEVLAHTSLMMYVMRRRRRRMRGEES